MVRQCAWCLHLVNSHGEPISTFPLPKLYEATHVMCQNCGLRWMEAVESQKEGQTAQEIQTMPTMPTIQATPASEESDNIISLSLSGGRC